MIQTIFNLAFYFSSPLAEKWSNITTGIFTPLLQFLGYFGYFLIFVWYVVIFQFRALLFHS